MIKIYCDECDEQIEKEPVDILIGEVGKGIPDVSDTTIRVNKPCAIEGGDYDSGIEIRYLLTLLPPKKGNICPACFTKYLAIAIGQINGIGDYSPEMKKFVDAAAVFLQTMAYEEE